MRSVVKHITACAVGATLGGIALVVYGQSIDSPPGPEMRYGSEGMQTPASTPARSSPATSPAVSCDDTQPGCVPAGRAARGAPASSVPGGVLRSDDRPMTGLVITPDSDWQTNRIDD